ncbi:site-specific DNA-methyltransferase [Mangrovicoccus sp. HB161399]|uniref:site-specific DNA-methyltransferase n=1 Tax=Mangrovicoccus sp. HB161399 TaxID=2720392 RepID=UPI00155212DB|nr:site-specific DNA-methyltransferase [Mangrovicoccus sp. HB161399]
MTDKTTPIDPITHSDERLNIPTPELAPMMDPDDAAPIKVAYRTRNPDLDPQLIWRGKDVDQAALTLDAPPIYLQEQVHPKAIIEDLRAGGKRNGEGGGVDLFDHFGVSDDDREAEIEFYRHHRKWSNRMILGDGLQVMASLAEREGLKGQVQAIYLDPPYGIKFNSNFQWSTTSRDVKDGNLAHLTREPEQVKAFRDTWRDGIHSYLQYLRDRLVVAHELLTESGSCFVQIGDENVHRVRALMDEVFGEENFLSMLTVQKTGGLVSKGIVHTLDYLLWFAKDADKVKVRQLFDERKAGHTSLERYDQGTDRMGQLVRWNKLSEKARFSGEWFRARTVALESANPRFEFAHEGLMFNQRWKTNLTGLRKLQQSLRIQSTGKRLNSIRLVDDFRIIPITDRWESMQIGKELTYVVQTPETAIARCLLMTTDPGDLVLDPTCGSGTAAYVAEQWGRRWITIDTSRVALALARARIMGAKYPWYLLADSAEGQRKEAEVTRSAPATAATYNDIRHGFVYQRVPHITLKSIANNTEIDEIWAQRQPAVEDSLAALNVVLRGHTTPFPVETGGRKGKKIDFTATGDTTLPSGERAPAGGLMEWEVPRQAPKDWPAAAKPALDAFWSARIARQQEIDASIAAKAEFEYLYDKPYEDKKRVRVAGPFTVESLSPHRTQAVNEHGELIDEAEAAAGGRGRDAQEAENYLAAILENLRKAGVQQSDRADKIEFTSLTPGWGGEWIVAEGRYMEGETERRAAIFVGPEYGTVQRADLVAAARETADGGFDILIACAFNFDAHTAEFRKLGRVPVLHARMNPDLHMAGDLKAGGGNLFVVFGEPDIAVVPEGDRFRVELKGVDIFKPATGEVVSSEPDDIACWFIDTDYNMESFFVRHAYFPGADVPYKQLKTTLKGEIDEDAWESLKRTVSRPFARPKSGRIAVKVINHLGDEVMKVMKVMGV